MQAVHDQSPLATSKGDEKEDGEWSTPTRVGRSPGKSIKELEFGQVSILSHSCFSILSESDKDGDPKRNTPDESSNDGAVTVETNGKGDEENTFQVTSDNVDINLNGENQREHDIPIRQS